MAKGNFIEYIVSDNPNKYPNSGEQGDYYYEIVEDVTPEVTAQVPIIQAIADNFEIAITTPSGSNKEILQGNNENLQNINQNAKALKFPEGGKGVFYPTPEEGQKPVPMKVVGVGNGMNPPEVWNKDYTKARFPEVDDNDCLYFYNGSAIVKLNPDGEEIATLTLSSCSTMTFAYGYLYVSSEGYVSKYDTDFNLISKASCGAAIIRVSSDGTAYCGSGKYCYKLTQDGTKTQIWYNSSYSMTDMDIDEDGNVYINTSDYLFKIGLVDGAYQEIWKIHWSDGTESGRGVVYLNGFLFATTTYYLYKINPSTGIQSKTYRGTGYGSLKKQSGFIYGMGVQYFKNPNVYGDPLVKKFDMELNEIWRFTGHSLKYTTSSDIVVYMAAGNGYLYSWCSIDKKLRKSIDRNEYKLAIYEETTV